ncbi:MAG TPA: MTAP family purine nucleoside phosphorylase [Candidatus Methylomirabilis sp.]|nr:MTAP family purine nucleoside phosphorylase [Candidatus Methylomirabilis sp.]
MDGQPRRPDRLLSRGARNDPPRVLLLGGSGAYALPPGTLGERLSSRRVRTPYGLSNPVHLREASGFRFLFLSRHGERGYDTTAPYVNYRANIYAAKSLGVTRIVSWTGPGAISRKVRPGDLVLPDDLLDFTRNRPSTFYEGKGIGFLRQSPVFCERLRDALRSSADRGDALRSVAQRREAGKRHAGRFRFGGTYACTEGPRLETPAEIRFLARAGADLVGMTLCPEAFLARELEICYAAVAYVTNYAEGVRKMPYRRGALFEGMLPPGEASAVEAAKNAIPGIAIAAARALAGEERDCPCAVSMERYRKRGVIGPDFRGWVAKPGGAGR